MMWDGWSGGGWSPFMWIMPLMMFVFWILIIVGIVFLIRWLIESSRPGGPVVKGEAPMDILKQRYAKGEITKEQFDQMKKDLAQGI
jgi:putative membrane protein